jgi:putative ABC transport system permease protein
MFGIAWGIISLTLLIGACQGLAVGLERQAKSMGTDIIILWPAHTSMQVGGMRAGRKLYWKVGDASVVARQSPDCRYVLPELEHNVGARSLYNSGSYLTTGSLPAFARVRDIQVARGRFYNALDNQTGVRVAFLGSRVKKQLFGSRPALGKTIWLGNFPYRVIGIMRRKKQTSSYDGMDVQKIFVPFRAMARDFPNPPPDPPGTVNHLILVPRSVALDSACKREARATLASIHHFNPRDKEATPAWDTIKDARENEMLVDGMQLFLGAVGIVTLFLGGIGVMNVMLVSVRERTREIGVRMAIGAKRSEVLRQFFLETLLVAFISGGTGLMFAYGICWLVDLAPMPPFFAGLLPTWQSSLLAVGLLGAVAVLSGIYPARRAAKIDPVEALRFEAGG